ncbi:hypothetical protein FOA52_005180 [Chlamydomonas sp. UWO 241]|nr:hypothetical protein FOA52_005180 [Chlamydomonas sp. UWO 241]
MARRVSLLLLLVLVVCVVSLAAEPFSRMEFIVCPVDDECGSRAHPHVYKFLREVVEHGDYPSVSVAYDSRMQQPVAVFFSRSGEEVDRLGVSKLMPAEINSLIRTKGFRRSTETAAIASGIFAVQLMTAHGNINIKLRPDWSQGSVDYMRELASHPHECDKECRFYRAEKDYIVQGTLAAATIPHNNVTTPGPRLMERGDVGWAGGEPGPHFFIYVAKDPAKHFGLTHTVWGVVADAESLAVANTLAGLPAEAENPTVQDWPKYMVKKEKVSIRVLELGAAVHIHHM